MKLLNIIMLICVVLSFLLSLLILFLYNFSLCIIFYLFSMGLILTVILISGKRIFHINKYNIELKKLIFIWIIIIVILFIIKFYL